MSLLNCRNVLCCVDIPVSTTNICATNMIRCESCLRQDTLNIEAPVNCNYHKIFLNDYNENQILTTLLKYKKGLENVAFLGFTIGLDKLFVNTFQMHFVKSDSCYKVSAIFSTTIVFSLVLVPSRFLVSYKKNFYFFPVR